MASLLFIDSAFPLGRVIAGAQGIAFYIGGDTPHVWSKAEVDAEPYRYRLPIYVRSNPPGPGAIADVAACVAQLDAIGAPRGILVAWDMETSVDAAYIGEVYLALRAAGYQLIVYASQSFIPGQGNPDGLYWGAQWTGSPHIAAGDAATQYANFGGYDESEGTTALPFWDTHAATPPPLPPPPSGNQWPLTAGSNGPNVVTLQENLNARKFAVPPLVTDGAFGPLTLAAVKFAQRALLLQVTGIVDEATWKALAPPPPLPPGTYPVPAKVTAVVQPNVTITWEPGSPLSPHWRLEVAADDAGKPGAAASSLEATVPHATVTLPRPGKFWYRVQSAGNSPFTPWTELTA